VNTPWSFELFLPDPIEWADWIAGTGHFVDVLIWLNVEMSAASVCISLPSCFLMISEMMVSVSCSPCGRCRRNSRVIARNFQEESRLRIETLFTYLFHLILQCSMT
jgi:hypothetical protein